MNQIKLNESYIVDMFHQANRGDITPTHRLNLINDRLIQLIVGCDIELSDDLQTKLTKHINKNK